MLLLVLHLSLPITEVNIAYTTCQANLMLVGDGCDHHWVDSAGSAGRCTSSLHHTSFSELCHITRIACASTIDGVCAVHSHIIIKAELMPPTQGIYLLSMLV